MIRLITSVAGVALLAGCAIKDDLYVRNKAEDGKHVSTKVYQLKADKRMAFVSSFGTVCSEPSPDAISSFASTLGIDVKDSSGLAAALSGSAAQAAASIGLRTQSIQTLRDAMFSVCSLYQGKALKGSDIAVLHSSFQDVMVSLVAIEQLTGATVAAQAAVNANSSANTSKGVSDLESLIEKAEATLEDLSKKKTEQEGAVNLAKAGLGDAESTLETVLENEESTEESMTNARETVATKKEEHLLAKEALGKTEALTAQAEAHKKLLEESNILVQTSSTLANASGTFNGTGGAVGISAGVPAAVQSITSQFLAKNRADVACASFVTREGQDLIDTIKEFEDMSNISESEAKDMASLRSYRLDIANKMLEAYGNAVENCKAVADTQINRSREIIDVAGKSFAAALEASPEPKVTIQNTPRKPEPINTSKPNKTHTVVKGDTLYSIAKKYATTVDELKKLNTITDENAISIGTVIKLPQKAS